MNEATARLEAKLRGLRFIPDGEPYTLEDMYDSVFLSAGRQWSLWGGHLGQAGDQNFTPCTDPATAEGREWWCEALKFDINWSDERDTDQWHVEWFPNGEYFCLSSNDSRTAAIIAAIEAAAEQFTRREATR